MKRGIKIKQHDTADCGAACIASVCAYYGLHYPVSRIRQYAFTNEKSTNISGLVEAANKLGLSGKGVRAKFEALRIVPKPAIAHINDKGGLQHFIVIYKVTDDYVSYMDPVDGRIHKAGYEEFQKEWTGILVLLEPEKKTLKQSMQGSNLARFISLLSPHKRVLFQALFGAVIFSALGLSMAVFVGKITDYVLVAKNMKLLHLMGVLMFIILILRTFVGSMKSILTLKTGQRISTTLILGYYKHLLKLPQQFFDSMRGGEAMSRVNDAARIRNFISNVSMDIIVNMLILLFSFGMMFVYSWKLALLTLASIPAFAVIYFLFNRLNRKSQRKIMENNTELEVQLAESFNSIATVKRFGIEDYIDLKTESRFVHVLRSIYTSIYGTILTQAGIQFISTGITIAVLWAGSILVINQELTPGALMVFYALINYVLIPIGLLITSNQTIQDALIAAGRLFRMMELEQEEGSHPKVALEPEMIGDIVFEDVYFRYGSRKEVFDELNMRIEKGKTTAIIGESGSGKTTLVSLLQNIYPIQSGKIKIGGYDLSQISNESLRQRVRVVPQQIELFSGTIASNIALGDLNPDMNRISELAQQLGLDDFIGKLPDGYHTNIGEYGITLSGGERQRVAIARALYKEPEILIFDEATSSLDSLSERYVKKTLKALAAKGKTIIVIAHRLSTVRNADALIVLNEGKVVETGSHQELTKTNGIYSKLWYEQFGQIA